MPAIKITKFLGAVPRLAPHLLPDGAARIAQNLDLTKGYFLPLNDGATLATLVHNPTRGLYTQTGINFFSWVEETYAFKSPVIGEVYDRMYFLRPGVQSGTVRVVRNSETVGAGFQNANGGSPATTYKLGVPAPTTAPTLTLVDHTVSPVGGTGAVQLRDYPSATVTFLAWYDSDGTRYESHVPTLNSSTAFKAYTITVAAPGVDVPDGAKVVVQIKCTDTSPTPDSDIFVLDTSTDDRLPARSNGLPGGLDVSITKTATANQYTVSLAWGIVETRAYVYTYENGWDEESAPSPAGTLVSPTYIQDVHVSLVNPIATGLFSFGHFDFARYNLYRTVGSNADYLRVKVVSDISATPSPMTFYDDTAGSAGFDTLLTTTEYNEPPENLLGIVIAANGWFAAFKTNTLYMSEPYKPFAWPYSMTFEHSITGVCAAAGSLVVTTYGGVYVVTGPHPRTVSQTKLHSPQPGLSHRSMTSLDGMVAYASRDGIVTVSGAQASLAGSQQYFTRDVWRAASPSALSPGAVAAGMRFNYYDGQLIATSSYSAASEIQYEQFIINLDTGSLPQLTRTILGAVSATFSLPATDSLYYTVGATLKKFGSGSALQGAYHSKNYSFERPVQMAVLFMRKGAGATEIYISRDDVGTTDSLTISSAAGEYTFRLQPGKGYRWSFLLFSYGPVYEVSMASSIAELRDV